MATATIEDLIKKILGMKRGNVFAPYIDYIVFPRYRRIAPKQRIDFEFPLTILVGRNGTGKSSVLHALYGAPEGRSVATFWFGTAVDPVERGEMVEFEEEDESGGKKKLAEEQKAAFWYGYKDEGVERQAIKQRVRRENANAYEDQENWEPTRPNETYGMSPIPREGGKRGRAPQIKMKVSYLNLRYHLSAFDRCFNFWSLSSLKRFSDTQRWHKLGGGKKPRVQHYIRSRAVRLNRAIESNHPYKIGKTKFAERPIQMTKAELDSVSAIVGKAYQSGMLLKHRLYDDAWGYSVRFTTGGGRYTEANAGSGETSVVQIVRMFEDAEPNSLLLLDEPETSLHPGAQRQLLHYILDQIARKKLQVVLSTHAPALVYSLPREAVKVMRHQADGLIVIEQGLSAEEAFHEIGHPFDPKCNVIVEDRLTKQILEDVAKAKGEGFAAKVRVEYRPGGDSAMKKDVAVFMHGAHKPVFVFDGDKKGAEHIDPDNIALNLQTPTHLDEVIKSQTGQDIRFQQDSGMTEKQKAKLRADYLKYYLRRVFYMPFPSAEEGMWDDDVCQSLLQLIFNDPNKVTEVTAKVREEPDFKTKFDTLSKAIHDSLHPSPVHTMFVARFVAARSAGFNEVSDLLEQVVNASEAADA